MRPSAPRNLLVYILIMVAIVALFWQFASLPDATREIAVSEVAQYIKDGVAKRIEFSQNGGIKLLHINGTVYESQKEPNIGIGETLRDLGVTSEQLAGLEVVALQPSAWENWGLLLVQVVPMLFFGGFLMFMLRQAQSGNNQAMSFGKSRARMFTGDRPTSTFEDVAGADEAKQELAEVVEFLKEPSKFTALGARIPKGVLLVGPPGTGKTLLARAVAGEAGVPFFSISGSEFVEMFVGVGASRVRDLFDQAKRNSPCIVFVDEVDAVGRQRGAGLGGSHDEREQTLNQILVEMDGFDTDTNVIVIAATNRPDILDPALLRPGRFDRRVVLDRPDRKGREDILKIHVRGKPLAPDVDLGVLAKRTPGFTGADIENLVNEAAILAARRNKRAASMEEFTEAVDRVIAGPERRSRIISDKEKRITAYHEAGHALCFAKLEHTDRVDKVSIIARGMYGGYTLAVPDEDRNNLSRSELVDELAATLGGRAAEVTVFNEITTGASQDLRQATQTARNMIMQWGMSETLGQRTFGKKEELVFLGREIAEQRDFSEEVAAQIDREIKDLMDGAYERALQVVTTYRDRLDAIANRLIEVETLERAEFEAIVNAEAPASV